MLYVDNDYKLDCENKIQYDTMSIATKTEIAAVCDISNVINVYKFDGNNLKTIYLVKTSTSNGGDGHLKMLMTVDSSYVKEIAENLYKVVISGYYSS